MKHLIADGQSSKPPKSFIGPSITEDEVQITIKQMKDEKAIDPD